MATPRRPWFRIEDTILREPLSRDAKISKVLLTAWWHQRWSRARLTGEEACRALLSPAHLQEITGRAQLVHARRALRELCATESLAIHERGKFTEIYWPKFAESQYLIAGTGPGTGRESPPPETETETKTEEEISRRSAAHPAAAPPGSSRCAHAPQNRSGSVEGIPPWALEASAALLQHVRSSPGGRVSRGARERWARDIALLPAEVPDLGPDPLAAVLCAIAWLGSPSNTGEFAILVQSGRTLREKWPKIVAAQTREQSKPRRNNGQTASGVPPSTSAPPSEEEQRERVIVERLQRRYRIPPGKGVPRELVELAMRGANDEELDTEAERLSVCLAPAAAQA